MCRCVFTNRIIDGENFHEFHKCLICEKFTLLFNRHSKQSGKFSPLKVRNGSIRDDFLPQKAIHYKVYISACTFGLCVHVRVCVCAHTHTHMHGGQSF